MSPCPRRSSTPADDHRVVRDGLCYLLGQEPDVEVVGEAGDGRRAVDVVAATRPDVLLLDLYMPGVDGHAVLSRLNETPGRPAVVVLTSAADDEHLVRAMHAGATSYVVKTHVRSILVKLGLHDRVQAAIFALRHQADSHERPRGTILP